MHAEAIVHAALQSPLTKDKAGEAPSSSVWFERALRGYLCREHIENRPTPCPLAFMVTDVGARDPKVRNAYTRVYKNLVRLMKTRLKD